MRQLSAVTARIARRQRPASWSFRGAVSSCCHYPPAGSLVASDTPICNSPCRRRTFSSSASAQPHVNDTNNKSSKTAPSFATAMRSMVRPFFMKCHPDVQTSESAKEINLVAIQNLNAYLDSVEAKLKAGAKIQRNETTIYQVDFCILVEERVRGKKEEILCRRKVELSLPTLLLQALLTAAPSSNNHPRLEFQRHVEHQLVKLLHVAGVKAPQSSATMYQEPTTLEEDISNAWNDNNIDRSNISAARIRQARQQKYERNRDAFVSNMNWKRFDEIYQETLRDVQASHATEGLIRDDPQRRMAHLAEILSHVRVGGSSDNDSEVPGEVDPVMQLVALRRLSLLLDYHFDELRLEDLGRMWESTTIVLTPARSFNTSPSAMYKRRKRKVQGDVMANDGFAIALHHDNSVTIHVPVDFRDDELLAQLKRHVTDYSSLLSLGLEDIFPSTSTSVDDNREW